MTDRPKDFAPLNGRSPFIKNVTEIAAGLWLADAAKGTTGRAKVWYTVLIARNPKAGQLVYPNHNMIHAEFDEIGAVKPVKFGYKKGLFSCRMYNRRSDDKWSYVDATFTTHQQALDFLKLNAEFYNGIS